MIREHWVPICKQLTIELGADEDEKATFNHGYMMIYARED